MFGRIWNSKAILVAAMVGVGFAHSGPLNAQKPSANLMDQVVGTWTVVSQFVEQEGRKTEPFGAHPKGLAVYGRTGRFISIVQSGDLPKFASRNRLTGTPEENRAIVQGSIAYYGTFSINEKEGKINYHFEGCTYPNWDGEDQTRSITISGDDLNIVSPVSTVGKGTVHVRLRRVK